MPNNAQTPQESEAVVLVMPPHVVSAVALYLSTGLHEFKSDATNERRRASERAMGVIAQTVLDAMLAAIGLTPTVPVPVNPLAAAQAAAPLN